MNNFKVMYRILRLLDRNKGDETFDYEQISAKAMNIGFAEWEQLMIELQMNGCIRGLVYSQSFSQKFPHICEPIQPCITMKGMEYLENNSMMAKAKELLELAGNII